MTGSRGTARFFNVTVHGARTPGTGVLHEPFGDTPEANITGPQLDVGDDGQFELYIGGDAARTELVATHLRFAKMLIRQGFDRWYELPAQLRIGRIDMSAPKPLPTAEVMVEAMSWAGDFVTGLMSDWPEFPFTYGGVDAERPNTFPRVDTTGDDAKRVAPRPTCTGSLALTRRSSSSSTRTTGCGC